MRILGVQFKNINSLREEVKIRFDVPPLADTRLFAIVGPNGSGKTSILDAVTLALYGETPRWRSTENGGDLGEEGGSFSEVTFSVGEDLYCARWSVSGRMEERKDPEMSLSKLNGAPVLMEDRVVKVRERVAELTGLDFKRFCCSILLPQGDFAVFLNALDNERAEILEKIIGPEMQRELEASIFSKTDKEREKLLELQEAYEHFPMPDPGSAGRAAELCEQTREELQEVARGLSELEARKAWFAQREKAEAECGNSSEDLTEAVKHRDLTLAAFQSLEQARSLRAIEEDAANLDHATAERDSSKQELDRLQGEISSARARIRELELAVPVAATKLEEARALVEEHHDAWTAAGLLDREVEEAERIALEASTGLEDAERSLAAAVAGLEAARQRIPELTARREELENWLADHKEEADLQDEISSVELLLTRLAEVRGRLGEDGVRQAAETEEERRVRRELQKAEKAVEKARRKVDDLAGCKSERDGRLSEILGDRSVAFLERYADGLKEKMTACRELADIGGRYRPLAVGEHPRAELGRIRSQEEVVEQTLAEEEAALAALEGSVKRRDTVQRLAEDRRALKPDEACPLCGAFQHPYVEQGLPDFADLERALQGHALKIQALREHREELSRRKTELAARAEAMEGLERRWKETCERAAGDWAMGDMDRLKDEIRGLDWERKDVRARIRGARWMSWGSFWVERRLARKTKRLRDREQVRDALLLRHESIEKILRGLGSEVREWQEAEKRVDSELNLRLHRCGESPPSPGGEEKLGQSLRDRHDLYLRSRKEHTGLVEQLQSLQSQVDTTSLHLDGMKERIAALAREASSARARAEALRADRYSLHGDMDPAREREAARGEVLRLATEEAALARELATLQTNLEEWRKTLPLLEDEVRRKLKTAEEAEQRLLEKASSFGVFSVDDVRMLLTVLMDEQGIVERYGTAEREWAEAEARAKAARDAFEALQSVSSRGDSLDGVLRGISEAVKRRGILQSEFETAERTVESHRQAKREHKELESALAAQKKIWEEAEADSERIKSREDARARRAIQRLMIERLVEKANVHLSGLAGPRSYRLSLDQGCGIEVVDVLGNELPRPVRTLSGGESFVVSLCLALGLSDMAAGRRKIESLFLDEGFGTLDDEMLHAVLAALRGLRDNGKTVGIISHVKRLADNIPTQIRVERDVNGCSRVALMA